MGKVTHHGFQYKAEQLLGMQGIKTISALLAAELGMFFLALYKQVGLSYIPFTLVMMAFSVIVCIITFRFDADKYLLVCVLVLMNVGFVVQQIDTKGATGGSVKKLAVVITAVLVAAFLYSKLAWLFSKDYMIFICIFIQYAISISMIILGKVVGNIEEQGARIDLNGITLLEVVKVIYIFVVVGLLCKREDETIHFIKWNIDREIFLVVHTCGLALCFIGCKELGTLMIMGIVVLTMLWIYGKRHKAVTVVIIISVVGFIAALFICQYILYSGILKQSSIPKLIRRFGTVFHPEKAMNGAGYQGTLALEALSIGGILGASSERYRLVQFPEYTNDFIFANVIQTCGLLMGFIVIFCFFVLLKRGIEIARKCEDSYFQGMAIAIAVLIVGEAIIHIGYNIAILPITGIPLYFVSAGFTAILTAMTLIAILLVISTGNVERTV